MTERKKILPQMFDVRPVNGTGDLDVEKIQKMEKIVTLVKQEKEDARRIKTVPLRKAERKPKNFCGRFEMVKPVVIEYDRKEKEAEKERWEKFLAEEARKDKEEREEGSRIAAFHERLERFERRKKKQRIFLRGAIALAVVAVFVIIANAAMRGLEIKRNGLADSQTAIVEMLAAKDSMKSGDFEKAYAQFNGANEKLDKLSAQFDGMGRVLVSATKYVPYLSKVSSGSHLISAAESVSNVGVIISDMLRNMDTAVAGRDQGSSISYLKIFRDNEDNLKRMAALLDSAQKDLDSVNLDDIPEENRSKFIEMKRSLPEVNSALAAFLGEEKLFSDILGGNGPRKYLFLFQNNQEIRATGGFIGSYGLLDIFDGRVRKFFIDGIFNPDGQLQTRIVPPAPIQKISANWSLHDSNWFPDFPTSAEKAAWFYEKAGGPTVDGVITMTPTVMQKLLEVTGPIEMPEYGITVDKDNFIREIQYQVEVDYDKKLNAPKKILGDLAPKILDRILNMKDFSELSKALNVMLESLNEKQILIYSKNPDIEKVLSANGWSGEILNTPKDYLSVINTNVNGFKTDGVVDEEISHKAEIRPDGSVVDTLTVVRHHNGGDTPYEWWNKVSSDYMRVYVPKGSQLLRAEGQTREIDSPPLDYKALGYVYDPQVQKEAEGMRTDPDSGTTIYDDGEKTVFANWVYVSPKETVTIKYVYILPFKMTLDALHLSDTYSLLTQKQSGSRGSGYSSEIDYPSSYKTLWQSPDLGAVRADDLPDGEAGLRMETDLKTDKFSGIAFTQ